MTLNASDSEQLDSDLYRLLLAYEESKQVEPSASPQWLERCADPKQVTKLERALRCVDLLSKVSQRDRSQSSVSDLTREGAAMTIAGPELPCRLGKFTLLREIGSGGFGIVYLAVDNQLQREVALKIARPGRTSNPEFHERFLREARAAAVLDHPHIVPVFECAEVGPTCYVALAYCDGGNLSDWIEQHQGRIPPREAARITALIADAIHHAHSRGVLHRDLKPANILMTTERRARESTSGEAADSQLEELRVPKITDFGLARVLADDSKQTRTGAVMGTAAYMAPEQANGNTKDVGVHTDVYGIGAILYQLLTGRPPFDGDTYLATLKQVESAEPTPPRQIASRVPRDLETICLKCLSKNWKQRYSNAEQLADDLRRFLAGDTIRARPAGIGEKLGKWCRRRPAVATALLLASLFVIGIASGAVWHYDRLRIAKRNLEQTLDRETRATNAAHANLRRAERVESQLRRHLYASQLRLIQQYVEHSRPGSAAELLEETRHQADYTGPQNFTWRYWENQLRQNLFPMLGKRQSVNAVAVSPGTTVIATSDGNGTIRLWDRSIGRCIAILEGHSEGIECIALSPDGRLLASSCRARKTLVWDIASRKCLLTREDEATVNDLTFSPDGTLLASSNEDRTIRLWNVENGSMVRTIQADSDQGCLAIVFVPNSQVLVSGYGDGMIRHWNTADGSLVESWHGGDGSIIDLEIDRSGRRIATEQIEAGKYVARVRELDTKGLVWQKEFDDNFHMPITLLPDGHTVAMRGAEHGTIVLRNVDEDSIVETIAELRYRLVAIAAADEGAGVAVVTSDGLVGWWSRHYAPPPPLPGHAKETWSVCFSSDGKLLVSGSDDETARLWDVEHGTELGVLRGHMATVSSVALTPDDRVLATASLDGEIKLWDVATRRELTTLTAHKRVRCVAFSPNGRWLASGDYDGRVVVWDWEKRKIVHDFAADSRRIRAVTFSPDSRVLAAASESGKVLRWEVESAQPLPTIQEEHQVWTIAFHPYKPELALGTDHGNIHIWNLDELVSELSLTGHTAEVRSLTYSPDARLLVSGSEDSTVRIWDAVGGQQQSIFKDSSDAIYCVDFAATGDRIAACSFNGSITVWSCGDVTE